MAISKKTGREYSSRREAGYTPDKRRRKPDRYPKGFNRWGYPITCGVIDEDGNECREPVTGAYYKCEYHRDLHATQRRSGESPDNPGGAE